MLQITPRTNPEKHTMQAEDLRSLLERIEHHVNAVWVSDHLVYGEFRPDTWPQGWRPRR